MDIEAILTEIESIVNFRVEVVTPTGSYFTKHNGILSVKNFLPPLDWTEEQTKEFCKTNGIKIFIAKRSPLTLYSVD